MPRAASSRKSATRCVTCSEAPPGGPGRRRWRAGVLVLALVACGGGDEPLPRLGPGEVILAFGDCLTFGTGARPEESYPAVLEALTGRPVVNAGVPGEVSEAGRRRLPGVLEQTRPRLVVLIHGGNDILRRVEPGTTERNLREMVGAARGAGAAVVLLGVPQPGLFLSAAGVYRRLAEELGLPYDGEAIPGLLGDNRMKSDAIHPNAAGYRQLAEAVRDLLREGGAL